VSRKEDDSAHVRYGDQLLSLVELALRQNGQLLPVTLEQITAGEADASLFGFEEPIWNVPTWYDDPFAALQVGRHLIAHPPALMTHSTSSSLPVVGALALAARNGHQISPEVRAAMDTDRRKSEIA
jgi:hypothetical protein